MAQLGNPIVSPTTRSRLAQIIGLPSPGPSRAQSPQTQKQEDEWYIPYNGPIEPPPRGRPRGNTFGGLDEGHTDAQWDAEDDTFGYRGVAVTGGGGGGRARATSNATAGTRKSYASSSSTPASKTFFGPSGGGIGEAPVHSAASVHSARDRLSSSSARDREREDWEREQRGSIASFLTFGQGSRASAQRPSVNVNVSTGYASSGLLPSSSTSRHPAHTLSPVSPPYPHRPARRSDESASGLAFPVPQQHRARRSEDSASSAQVHVYAFQSPGTRGRQRSGTAESVASVRSAVRPVALSLTAADRARGKQRERGAGEEGGRPSAEVSTGSRVPGSASTGTGVGRGSSEGHQAYGFGEPRVSDEGGRDGRGRRERLFEPDREREQEQEASDGEEQMEYYEQYSNARLRTLSHSASQPVLPRSAPPIQRHPYAIAFPSPSRDTTHLPPHQPPYTSTNHPANSYASPKRPLQKNQLAGPSTPVLPSHFSSTTVSTQSRPAPHRPPPTVTVTPSAATVSPAAIAAALNNHTAPKIGLARGLLRSASGSRSRPGSLKASFSTPNLRGMFRMGTGEKEKAGKPPKTQYAAETWCDALMFPRPRFRAHVISPPESPTDVPRLGAGISAGGRDGAGAGLGSEVVHAGQGSRAPLRKAATAAVVQTTRAQTPPPALPPLEPPRTPPRQDYFSTVTRTPPRHDYLSTDPAATSKLPPILAPAEETLRRVIAEGEKRDKEREAWNEVARGSFQNRRSRSLSRTRSRKKSNPTTVPRVRVESDASVVVRRREREREENGPERVGLTRTLTVGVTMLAAQAFDQPTPTISTASVSYSGGSESNAHSRNTSSSNGQGHARNTSWSKVALKKLCAPEPDVFSDAAASPQEEKLEGALLHEKTARMRVRGRREEAEEADVQFLDIAPLPLGNTHINTRLAVEDPSGRSRSQTSNLSDTLDVPVMGIALSTPPALSPSQSELPNLSAHPYAQPSAPRHRAEPVPVSATYAGPHPTASDYNRHRFPPHAQPQVGKPPEKRMYAALQSGAIRQVSTPEITQSPVAWERGPGTHAYGNAGTPGAYAYANVDASDKRESTLGVEEALMSRMFQRGAGGSAEDSGFGSVEDHETAQPPPPREPSPPAPSSSRVPRKPVGLNVYSGIPSLSHTVTTAANTDIPEPELVQHVVRHTSSEAPSPSSQSSWSQTSPRALGSMDDLEPFRDLFYKPGQPSPDQRTPSSERRKRLGSREGSGSLGNDRDFEEGGSRHIYGQRLDGLQEERLDSQNLSLPDLNDDVSLQMGSPLRADYEEGQDFPEDIQSSRASSDIEHESIEETLRLGSVALAVPATTHTERHQSTLLSYGDTEDGESVRPNRDTVFTATSSFGIPATVEDLVRTSFLTTTSATSHMSNLIEDFPTPPVAEGVTPPSAALLQSYFPSPEPHSGMRRPQTSLAHSTTAEDDTTER